LSVQDKELQDKAKAASNLPLSFTQAIEGFYDQTKTQNQALEREVLALKSEIKPQKYQQNAEGQNQEIEELNRKIIFLENALSQFQKKPNEDDRFVSNSDGQQIQELQEKLRTAEERIVESEKLRDTQNQRNEELQNKLRIVSEEKLEAERKIEVQVPKVCITFCATNLERYVC